MSSGSETPSKRWYSRITTWLAANILPLSNDCSASPLTPKCSTNPDLASSSIVLIRVKSLAPERQHPVGARIGVMQGDDQPPHAPDITAGAWLRLGGSGQPLAGRIRHLQHRFLGRPRVVQEDQPGPTVEQGAEHVGAGLRADQGPISRVVQVVGSFVTSEPLREDASVRHRASHLGRRTSMHRAGDRHELTLVLAISSRYWTLVHYLHRRPSG